VDGLRILPIWIGPGEAQAIRRILSEEPFPRPLTHDLFLTLFGRLKVTVTRVVITDLKDGIYYAVVFLDAGGKEFRALPCLNESPRWIEALAAIALGR